MSKIVAFVSVTLDGVMQAPGRADEDQRGGFAHGGWAAPYSDGVLAKVSAESMADAGGLLLGRRTYEDLYESWSGRTDNPFSAVLTGSPKYVASRTASQPLVWDNSVLLDGDVVASIRALRDRPGKSLVVLGSGDFLRTTLMPNGLVDEYVLLIHPLVFGSGQRLFDDGVAPATLSLVDSVSTDTGVLVATYRPAVSAATG